MTLRIGLAADEYLADSPRYYPTLSPWLRSLLLGGGLYVALFVVVHAVLAFTSDGFTAADVACLTLVALPQWVHAHRRRADVRPALAVLVSAMLIAAGAIGLWTMHPDALDRSYGAWFLGAITIDLLGLAILGAVRLAWATMGVLVALTIAWAVSEGMTAAAGLGLIVRHIATLLVFTLLVLSLRRSTATSAAYQAVQLRRSTEEEAGRARAAARRVAVEQVLDLAGPTLQAIANGRRFSPEDRRQLLALEGSLRDQIRTPLLARGALRESIAAARRRGVNVLLMDEAEDADPDARGRAAAWLADQLDATAGGGFVGRLRDQGDAIRVSAVRDDHGETRSFAIVPGT